MRVQPDGKYCCYSCYFVVSRNKNSKNNTVNGKIIHMNFTQKIILFIWEDKCVFRVFLSDFAMILNSICKEIKMSVTMTGFLQNNRFHAAEGWKQFFSF